MARGEGDYFPRLRVLANDPRWRIREAVVLGLQKYGYTSVVSLLKEMQVWSEGTLLERRAAAAALCEPGLLLDPDHAVQVLEILDGITASILVEKDRRSDAFKVLRKGLAYCWSVAVAAQMGAGKHYMEKWVGSRDPDIRWIMKNNLKKKRLLRVDEEWVEAQLSVLS